MGLFLFALTLFKHVFSGNFLDDRVRPTLALYVAFPAVAHLAYVAMRVS